MKDKDDNDMSGAYIFGAGLIEYEVIKKLQLIAHQESCIVQ